jgi:hypothetical protein
LRNCQYSDFLFFCAGDRHESLMTGQYDWTPVLYVCLYVLCTYIWMFCMFVCLFVCLFVCFVCMFVCLYVCSMYVVCLFVCMCFVCLFVCGMYVCMYVFNCFVARRFQAFLKVIDDSGRRFACTCVCSSIGWPFLEQNI